MQPYGKAQRLAVITSAEHCNVCAQRLFTSGKKDVKEADLTKLSYTAYKKYDYW